MSKFEMELNEYRYTIGKKGMFSVYDIESGERIARMDIEILLNSNVAALGKKGFRMIEGEELEEVMDWVAGWRR